MGDAAPTQLFSLIIGNADTVQDAVGARILDAAFEQFCLLGFRRSSMEDVARRAGVGRVTIYRRFESKDKLVAALMQRETRNAIATVATAHSSGTDVESRWIEGFVAGMRHLRSHPLILGLLSTEPESVLPLLTLRASGGLALARAFLAAEIRRARTELGLPSEDAEMIAEIFARLTQSLVLTKESCLPVDDDAGAREFARRYIVPLVTGAPVTPR